MEEFIANLGSLISLEYLCLNFSRGRYLNSKDLDKFHDAFKTMNKGLKFISRFYILQIGRWALERNFFWAEILARFEITESGVVLK